MKFKNIYLTLILVLSTFFYLPFMASATVIAYHVANPYSTFSESEYDSANFTVHIDPLNTNWMAISSYDHLVDLASPGSAAPDGILDIISLNSNDYFFLSAMAPDGTVSILNKLDTNTSTNDARGNQAMFYGAYDNVWVANPEGTRPETGGLTGFFDLYGEGDYTFDISFMNKYGDTAGHGNTWMLMDVMNMDDPGDPYDPGDPGDPYDPGDPGDQPGDAPVPEPATMLLLGSGLVGLAGFRKKIKK